MTIKTKLLLLLVLAATLTGRAADFKAANGLYYNINADGNSVTVVGSPQSIKELTIPAGVNFLGKRYRVTTIGSAAFHDRRELTSVSIPSTVTTIKNGTIGYIGAFAGCTKLTSIVIPDAVTEIGDYAFCGCSSLSEVTIGNAVASIGAYAFDGCTSLTKLDIPNSVTSIGSYAFEKCTNLADINIPNSVTDIGGNAFGGDYGHTAWYEKQPDGMVYAGRVAYQYKGAMKASTTVYIKDGTVSISPSAFHWWAFGDGLGMQSVIIPKSVKRIGRSAFYKCTQLKVVSILGNSLEEIGDFAFEGCTSLNYIDLPSSLTTIGRLAFSRCRSLTNLEFPNSLAHVGMSAFYDTPWYNNQPEGLVYVGRVAYHYKGAMKASTTIRFKEGTRSVADWAFNTHCPYTDTYGPAEAEPAARANLQAVVFPNSVTAIGDNAFNSCHNLASVTFGDAVESIGNHAFLNCTGLTELTLGSAVTSIGNSAFSWCKNLAAVTLPESLLSIGENAFSNCTQLTEIDIPNKVNTIGSRAFEGCTGLVNATVGESVFYLGGVLFNDDNENIERMVWNAKRCNSESYDFKLYAPCCKCAAFTFVFGDSVVNIPAFFGYQSRYAKSVTIGKSLQWIGEYAFNECSWLKTIKCFALVPPKFTDSENTFLKTGHKHLDLTLYVPAKTVKYYKMADVWKEFTILPLGDLTGDLVVDIDDLSIAINMLLKKKPAKDAADLNSDGVVDIDDVGAIINIMVGKM